MAPRADVGFGFRKAHRLRKTGEFSSVFASPRSQRSENFEVLFRPRSDGGARLGVVVGKRFAPTAVARNRVKRIARESFRHLRPKLFSADLVLRLRKRIDHADRRSLRQEIDRLLERLTP